jgi:hypothetical protein
MFERRSRLQRILRNIGQDLPVAGRCQLLKPVWSRRAPMLERDDALVKEAFHRKKQCARTSKRSPIERNGFPPVIPAAPLGAGPESILPEFG